jgi:hypothetical protein
MRLRCSRRDVLAAAVLLTRSQGQSGTAGSVATEEEIRLCRLSADALRPDWLWSLPEEVRLISDPPAECDLLLNAFTAVSASVNARFRNGTKLSVVSIGPILDSPDQVALKDLARDRARFLLSIDYTKVRITDITLPRNISWRPMISKSVQAALKPGRYEVTAVWHAVTAITSGSPLPVADLRQTFPFDIVS